MSWDSTWEKVFSERDWGRYPPEELIRFVARHYFKAADRKQVRIVEIGCGTGANVWFLAREGFSAYGMDGSKTAIEKAGRRMKEEGISADLRTGDVIALDSLYPDTKFDAVIDVACLVHNRFPAVKTMMQQIQKILKPGGRVFSMMFAEGAWGYGRGTEVEPGTFVGIDQGPLHGMGLVHFFSEADLVEMFGAFSDLRYEYSMRSMDERRQVFKLWVAEACLRT